MTITTPDSGNAPGLPAECLQDQLTGRAHEIDGLLAAVELATDCMIGIIDPDLAQKALPALDRS